MFDIISTSYRLDVVLLKSLMVYENNSDYLKYVDGVIMPLIGYSVSYLNKYTIEEIRNFVSNNKEKEVFVVINRNLFNKDILELEEILKKLDDIGVTGIFYYDISVLSIYRKHKFNFGLIWNQTHMVTNFNTINYYLEKGVKGAVLANEITLEEMLEIRKNTNASLFVNVVFCPIMSFSRRKLLSNYCKSTNVDIKGNKLYVKESSSGYKCIVLEEEDGTSVFSEKIVNNLDIVDNYSDNKFDYIIVDTSFLYNDIKESCLYALYCILTGVDDKKVLIKNMKELIGGNTGFLYRKTIYKVK